MASGDTVLEFTDCTLQHHLDGPAMSSGNTGHRWNSRLTGNKAVSPPQNYNVNASFDIEVNAVANALPFFGFALDPAKTYDVIIKEH